VVTRKAIGTEGQIALSAFATKTATGGGLNGSVRQMVDWSDTAPADGDIGQWDAGTGQYLPTDLSTQFAVVDANGRLAPGAWPKYMRELEVVNEGDQPPLDLGTGAIVYARPAAASLIPISHGVNGGANVIAATGIGNTFGQDVNPGEWIMLFVGASGEATLPSTYAITLSAGAVSGGFSSIVTGQQTGSAQADIVIGKCTTLIPAGSTVTAKANQNRVELIIGVASVANLVGTSVVDKTQTDAGGSSGTLALSTGATTATSQANELAVCLFVINSGSPPIRSLGPTPGSGWTALFPHFDAAAAGSTRGMRAFYKVLAATGTVQGQATVTATDSASGAHAGAVATLKAA
jgi:hypothetical protein